MLLDMAGDGRHETGNAAFMSTARVRTFHLRRSGGEGRLTPGGLVADRHHIV